MPSVRLHTVPNYDPESLHMYFKLKILGAALLLLQVACTETATLHVSEGMGLMPTLPQPV